MDKKTGTYLGCILGCALGDALGAPIEKKTEEGALHYINHCLKGKNFTDIPCGSLSGDSFGHVTEDTLFLITMVDSLIHTQGSFDLENFAHRCATLTRAMPLGWGGVAADRMRKGLLRSARAGGNVGNGALVRVLPLGLVYATSEEVIKAARLQAASTHMTQEVQACATAAALCVFYFCRGTVHVDYTATDFLLMVAKHITPLDAELGSQLRTLGGYLRSEIQEKEGVNDWVLDFIKTDVQHSQRSTWPGIQPLCRPTLLWALYSVLVHPFEIWEALVLAYSPGGDTDTVGALVGALVGIHSGLSTVPESLHPLLKDKEGAVWCRYTKKALHLEQVSQQRLREAYDDLS